MIAERPGPGVSRRLSRLVVSLLSGLLPGVGSAGPYDPGPPAAPSYGEVRYGDTQKAYGGRDLISPNGHGARPRDFGDQGRIPREISEGTRAGCLVSHYDGIRYFRCDPRNKDSAAGTSPTTAPLWQLVPGVVEPRRKPPPGARD